MASCARPTKRPRGWTIVLVATALIALQSTKSAADEVTAKGVVLQGKITSLNAKGITFEPDFGAGANTIKWEDVQAIKSAEPFQVLHGDDEELNEPLQGFSDGKLLVGESAAAAAAIDVTTIFVGFPIGADGPSFADRMRSSWRYWEGNLDIGFNLQRATTDTSGFLLGFKTKRSKGPTRFSFGADYRYSTQKQRDASAPGGERSTTIEDTLFGFVRGEYDFFPRFYGFASVDGTYDAIQKLSYRTVPKGGVGYVFWEEELDETKRNFLQGEVGGAWVYEQYFRNPRNDRVVPPVLSSTGDRNNYFAIAFGVVAGYYLPYGAHWDFRLDYLPAVDNFANDYLLRGETGLTVPLIDPLAAKFSLVDVYDSTPAPGTDGNSLFINIGLSLVW